MTFLNDAFLALYNMLFQNLGLTIIVLAIMSRILFIPSSISMIKYQRKMQDLKPKLDELKRKHKDDKKKQMAEQAKLFKENGINQASGCINAILQIVIAITLYNALTHLLRVPHLNTHFLLWDMTHPDTIGKAFNNLPIPGILVITSAVAQFVLSKMMAPAKPIEDDARAIAKKEHVGKEKKEDFADVAGQMQSQMIFLFPAMILFFGLNLPAGLALYWAITTVFAIVQQYILVGFGGFGDWLPKKGKDI